MSVVEAGGRIIAAQIDECPAPWEKWLNPQVEGADACYWIGERIGVVRGLEPDQVVVVDKRFCLADPCLEKIQTANPDVLQRLNSKGLIFYGTDGVVVIKFPEGVEGDDGQIRVVDKEAAKDFKDKAVENLQVLGLLTLLTSPFWGLLALREIRGAREQRLRQGSVSTKPEVVIKPSAEELEAPVAAQEPKTAVATRTTEVTWDDVRPVLDFLRRQYGPDLVITSRDQLSQAIDMAKAQGRTEVIEGLNGIAQRQGFNDIFHLLRVIANLRREALVLPRADVIK